MSKPDRPDPEPDRTPAAARRGRLESATLDAAEMAAQQRLHEFADLTPGMLWVAGPDGACTFVSRGWVEFTGQSQRDALGFGWLEKVHPDDRSRADAAFRQANERQAAIALEHRMCRADGAWRWVIDAGRPRWGPHGEFLGFVGSVTDIHDRRTAEDALRDSEERYRAFVANSSEGIWRMEFQPPVDTRLPVDEQVEAFLRSGRFAECNEAFVRMYGLDSPDQVIGHGLELMMDPAGPQVREYVRSLVQTGYRAGEVESQERGRDGRPLWFANNLSGVIENGLLLRAWGTQRDITLRKQAEAALVEADRRKDEFLATLAHELRNPLAPIRASAELLRMSGQHDERLARHAEVIGRQVAHLARMIDDLMDASRISRGKLELRLAPVVLQDVVRSALENVKTELQAGRHPLQLSLPDEPVRMVGDEVRLVQVVQNLLTNATRYSAAERPIAVSLETEDGHAVLRVRDQGIGIAADQIPRLFELFYQGGSESDRATGGLGIGLPLVQLLAGLHHGSVEVYSPGLGQGSEFLVRLPLPAGPVEAPDRSGGQRLAAAPRRRVLVVDDNRDAADMLAEVLRVLGEEVCTAYDGVEGLARAEAWRPEVVILDLGMPRLDGYGACRALRASEWGRDMVVLALSGWGQPADLERGAAAGFDGHLVKPVAPDILVRKIEELMAARHPA
ncbi:PAS domain S-box protein [Ramlibacter tataouinensis]|uniref:PAS domain-containing hybrid sensor histidine kinase/response regulator n=1 Tax=Ramlibacter tataouinensis TaxID=94132 RepID=UPI0022F3C695|nr:PAS domain S-box protein [Ramlibacter tataouinensis]WBY02528.1 PAS domain S-box protein [Ramlibacter tataouinensis]